jgi:uncharacterized protein
MNADLLVLGSAALSGLLGSAHCAAMCGGIATGFSVPAARASWLDAVEPNIGRIVGYTLAGALAGGIGHGVVAVLPLERMAQAMRAAVGLVLIIAALRLLDRSARLRFLDLPTRAGWRWLAPLQRRCLPADNSMRRLLAGVLWGWLPCGLSWTVLLAAWMQVDAAHGAMTMLAFGLGTLPAMVPLTWSGARIGQSLRSRGWRTSAGLVVLAAGITTLAAPWLGHMPAVHGLLAVLGCRSLA